MKLLHEIVKEEIAKFYPMRPKLENGMVRLDLNEILVDQIRRKDKAANRLAEDSALRELCFIIANQIIAASIAPGINDMARRDDYIQAVVEAISIWEKANERFNRELGMPPQLPAQKP